MTAEVTEPRETPALPGPVPASLAPLVAGRAWARDAVGEAGATVHRLHAPGRPDLYLKHGAGGDVADAVVDEMVRMRWLARHRLVPAIAGFVLDDAGAWLLMTAIAGRTAWQCLTDAPDAGARGAIVDALAADLRALHALQASDCPFDAGYAVRMVQARARIDAGLVDEDDFGDAHAGWSAAQVWDAMVRLVPPAVDRVVTHGDYSLDNILIADGRVAGLIDLGRVGVADRYQDLAILADCLDEFDAGLRERLFAGYGVVPDADRLRFHLCLDEMF